eukprot:UN30681
MIRKSKSKEKPSVSHFENLSVTNKIFTLLILFILITLYTHNGYSQTDKLEGTVIIHSKSILVEQLTHFAIKPDEICRQHLDSAELLNLNGDNKQIESNNIRKLCIAGWTNSTMIPISNSLLIVFAVYFPLVKTSQRNLLTWILYFNRWLFFLPL